jgi:hypothetical protein
MINTGDTVNLLEQYCDEPSEALLKCKVISGEELGKHRITIEFPLDMTINPTQTIPAHMVEVVK